MAGAKVYKNVSLGHSDACVALRYVKHCKENQIEPKRSEYNIRLAVCMAIISKDGKLLLTKRAKELRGFPNAWVMPGGLLVKH